MPPIQPSVAALLLMVAVGADEANDEDTALSELEIETFSYESTNLYQTNSPLLSDKAHDTNKHR